jgi:transaldolase
MMESRWNALRDLGQSVWYDNVARPAIETGLLERLIAEDNVTGGTSNPSIFANAVLKSDLYDGEIAGAPPGTTAEEIFALAAANDIRGGCDLFHGVWERAGGRDGFVSIEVEAALAYDRAGTVARARELWAEIDRPNLMVKVPGTGPGVEAVRELVALGVNVNITLLFATSRYDEVAEAYLSGLEERLANGGDLSHIDSVASFFVSRIDNKVDALLEEDSPLRGRIAIANAKLAYADVFGVRFTGPRWEKLKAAGANVQRPLWASTSTKNPSYPPTLYVDELIGPDTVNTVPDATLEAFRTASGTPARTIDQDVATARAEIAALPSHGIDLAAVTHDLEVEGVKAFSDAYTGMIDAIAAKRADIAAA